VLDRSLEQRSETVQARSFTLQSEYMVLQLSGRKVGQYVRKESCFWALELPKRG
jgi:hypothetical protein